MLNSVEQFLQAFYRLTGVEPEDPSLSHTGEAEHEVAFELLTRGAWAAQRHMLRMGYTGWRKRSDPIVWEDGGADGGKVWDLPADFLRAFGRQEGGRSALVTSDGRRWGQQTGPEDSHQRGNYYHIDGNQLRIASLSAPVGKLRLDYHYRHPEWNDDLEDDDIDFPVEARPLIVAEAAAIGADESWFPGDEDSYMKIQRARMRSQEEARHVSRPTKEPRSFRRPTRFGNHWGIVLALLGPLSL